MATNSYIGERPLGEIIQDVMRDLGEVVRGEVRLAKAEMGEKVSQASKSGVLFGGAALCGVMGFAALVFAAISALTMFVSTWVAALIVGAFLFCVAGVLFVGGRAKLKDVTPVPERTVQTLKDDVEWAKHPTK
jgi:Flp pilus assembly protein TadB